MNKNDMNRKSIGFLADRYMTEEEKNNACKLVAQTCSTFAAENGIKTNNMKQQEIKTMADAMTKVEGNCDAKLEMEARIFSQMDAETQQEKKDIEAYLQKHENREEMIKVLKTKLGLKKVEGIYGDIAVVSDSRYRMGVVTLDGEIIVPFGKYGWIGSFGENGNAPVRDGKRFSSKKKAKWGIISKDGIEIAIVGSVDVLPSDQKKQIVKQ